jgi:thiamine thiazole synthase
MSHILGTSTMSPAQTYEHPVASIASHKQDVCEDYEGNYRFAPIEEAQVSRAMIKR